MFLYIILNNIAPIFALVALGYFVGKKFDLDIFTMSKINFYIFIPSMIFTKIYEVDINVGLLTAVAFTFVFVLMLSAVGGVTTKLCRYPQPKSSAFKNAIMFYNSGNFGLPLITLVFANTEFATYAISIQIMVLLTQNLCTFTFGFYNAAKGSRGFKEAIREVLKIPTIYIITAAFLFRAIPYDLRDMFLWPAVLYARQGMIPVALLSLGIQISRIKINLKAWDVYLASFMRLCFAPLLACVMLLLLGMEGTLAKVLFISSAVPTAINVALIAVEFNSEPEFATQVVVATTLLSAATLPVVIYMAQWLF